MIWCGDSDEFIACHKPSRMRGQSRGQVRCLDYDELLKRNKLSLDLFTDALPARDVIAEEIADDLKAPLEQFTKIAARLALVGTRELEATE